MANINFICTSLRNRKKSDPLVSFSILYCSDANQFYIY